MDPTQAAAVGTSSLPPQPHMTTAMVVGPSHPTTAPPAGNSSMPMTSHIVQNSSQMAPGVSVSSSMRTISPSPKRVRLNPAQKQAVCDLLAGGARADYIVDTFGIAKRTVFKIQRAERLRQAEELANRTAAANAAVGKSEAVISEPQQQAANISGPVVDSTTMIQESTSAQMSTNPENVVIPSGGPAVSGATMTISAGNTNSSSQAGKPANPSTSSVKNSVASKKTTPPAKRVRLNVSEKLDICNFVQRGGTPAEVIEKYGISRRTFFKILHDEQDIRQTVDRDHVSAETKSIRPPHFPLLDQSLSAFVLSARAARVPLNWHMVREQALQLRTELLASGKEKPERIPHLERFTASEHWCQLFMRKNANKKLPSALDDPVQPARRHAMKETKHLQAQLGEFDPENVYTLVTPRLYYRYIPPRFFADMNMKHEPAATSTVSVGDDPEPFLTLLIAANLTGTKRLPIALIAPPGTANMADSRRPCLPLIIRPMQRCDSSAFSQWIRQEFHPFVVRNNGCKVALMLDETLAICTSSSFPEFADQISLVLVPRLSICMTETAKNGVFPLLVARYRFKLFKTYIALIPLREKLRKHAEIIPSYYRGLAEGENATVYDAADLLNDAWTELPADRIARCWWRMNVLPDNLVSSLTGLYGITSDVGTINEVSSFVLNIVRTNIDGKDTLTVPPQGKPRWISVLEIIRWFTYEYEMMPKQEQIERSAQVEANGRAEQNGLDWNVVSAPATNNVTISGSQIVSNAVAMHDSGPITTAGQPVVGSTNAINVGTSQGLNTRESIPMETDSIGVEDRKFSLGQFERAMKCYADLEQCILETQDSEALFSLRKAKKSSLSYFVTNGAADSGELESVQ